MAYHLKTNKQKKEYTGALSNIFNIISMINKTIR